MTNPVNVNASTSVYVGPAADMALFTGVPGDRWVVNSTSPEQLWGWTNTWTQLSGGGSVSEPAGEIVYGTGGGVSASPQFTFTAASGTLLVSDATPTPVMIVAGNSRAFIIQDPSSHGIMAVDATASRTVEFADPALVAMLNVNCSAARQITIADSAGILLQHWDTPASDRTILIADDTGQSMELWSTKSGVRTITLLDSLGAFMVVTNLVAATRTQTIQDETAQPVLAVSAITTKRSVDMDDGAGVKVFHANLLATEGNRSVQVNDQSSNPMRVVSAWNANLDRTITDTDELGNVVCTVSLRNGSATYTWGIGSSTRLVANASTKMLTSVSSGGVSEYMLEWETGFVNFGSKSVAALFAITPTNGTGAQAFAFNGRKFGEGPGAGTGIPVYYSGIGPSGATWYTYQGAVVTA